MIKIKAEKIAPTKAIIDLNERHQLIDKARQIEEVEVTEIDTDLPIEGLMKLAEQSGALDFLNDPREDIYTVKDLKVRKFIDSRVFR